VTRAAKAKTGLVLVGGGARGAYQAGVLQGLAEILGGEGGSFLDIITGISAGSINAAAVASQADRMPDAVARLHSLWADVRVEQVMRTDALSLMSIGSGWIRDLSFGGMMSRSGPRSNFLLDTAQLRKFLSSHIDFDAIAGHVERGVLDGVAVTATNYQTGTAVTFFESRAPELEGWARSARVGMRTKIGLEHVLASASIPLLFKPVAVEGAYYGDGGIRMGSPLSPAIHLGADRVLAISIRHPRSDQATARLNLAADLPPREISIADIAGVMLNAAFLDGLDGDAERMERINQTVALIAQDRLVEQPLRLRRIPLLVIRPSIDLGLLAADQFKRFPRALRYLMKGIGASDERGADFMSYLAFDPSYTRPLLEIGRTDALAQRDEIREVFGRSAS
jgi:NTE family protein